MRKNNMKITDKEYESLLSTAILTAYPRTFTGIPYSVEIFEELKKEMKNIPDSLLVEKLAPELEARFKLINKLLQEVGITQILELAAGYSTRGLVFAQSMGATFVEVELSQVCVQKKRIIQKFTAIPENLHILSGNALRADDIKKCTEIFDRNSPVAVINEGLLRYLNFDEKRIVARNIFDLLSEFGGVWITSDVAPKKFVLNQDKNIPTLNKNISILSNRNNINWRFEDEGHVRKFFEEVGFNLELHYFGEIRSELVSPTKLNLSTTQVDELLEIGTVGIMRANNS
jgi:O-methyltransferase involved in polyketide biosynthesis